VVADEVRKLVERTSAAAREIQTFSNDIGNVAESAIIRMERVVADAKGGAQKAQRANESIAEILQAFASVAQQVRNISNALSEQSAMSLELNPASIKSNISLPSCSQRRHSSQIPQIASLIWRARPVRSSANSSWGMKR